MYDYGRNLYQMSKVRFELLHEKRKNLRQLQTKNEVDFQ